MSRAPLIAITGGIGAGKSVVSQILRVLGYEVYDCDSRAKAIMDTSADIKQRLSQDIACSVIDCQGNIDRQELSRIVFADSELLARLNSIVHGAVRDDIRQWAEKGKGEKPKFIETAILYESGLDQMVEEVWEVTAPEAVRIDRVIKRSSLTAEQVRARIASQSAPVVANPHPRIARITNDGLHSLLLQIHSLLP